MHTLQRDLSEDLHELIEPLAENTYNVRARQRLAVDRTGGGWHGQRISTVRGTSDVEKRDHRNTAIETLKGILNHGYKLKRKRRIEGLTPDPFIFALGVPSFGG